jgi:putative tryptophan/tyrosine transport system substrate-binding protein
MRRRTFIRLIGGAAAAWPLPARAQQAMPVIGFLGSGISKGYREFVAAFHRGLRETGHVEGRNIAIEYRWADGQYDRLPALAAELVNRPVAVIAAGALPAALAAKAATSSIPIVFMMGSDAIKFGLVASLNRPGGNVTGAALLNNLLQAKQLEFLHEAVPTAASAALLVNPDNPNAEVDTKEAQAAARVLGLKLLVLNVRSESELDCSTICEGSTRIRERRATESGGRPCRQPPRRSRGHRDNLPNADHRVAANVGSVGHIAAAGLTIRL